MNTRGNKDQKFVEREFCEVEGGYYDEFGFYYTPDGSKNTLFFNFQAFGIPTKFTSTKKDSTSMVSFR